MTEANFGWLIRSVHRWSASMMVQARNEGRDLAREGNDIIRKAAKWSPELAAACEGFLEKLRISNPF